MATKKYMLNLINKLFKSSTPAATVMPALPWVKGLQGLQDATALEYAAQQLKNDAASERFKDHVLLQPLLDADEITNKIAENVTHHYLDIPNISMELEERMSQSAFLYHRQLFLIYLSLIETNSKSEEPQLALMIARAMHSATQMVRWRYYNYHSAPANVWLQLSSLYRLALKQNIHNTPISLYKDWPNFTLTQLYIYAMMLGSLESLSFKRQQIHLVHQMLIKWGTKITAESNYDEKKHLFYVDTALNMPAKRIRNFKATDSCFYWNFDAVNSKIDMSLSAFELNISPKQLGLDAFIAHPFFASTLEVLKTEWSRTDYKRQRRSEPRIKTAKNATTSYGFDDVSYQIKQYETLMLQSGARSYHGTKSLDERLASHSIVKSRADSNVIYVDLGAGYSNIVDESNKGIGLNVSKHANEVSLGMLIAVTVKEQKNGTRLGLIRSIKPIANKELQIGVEVINKQAFSVEMKNMSLAAVKARNKVNQLETTVTSVNIGTFTALFLPKDDIVASQETVVMPRLQYNKDDVFSMPILGDEILVKLGTILQRHEDWLRVAYTEQHPESESAD